ncbi:MAG TPA: DUF177 domain-containing protein [Stellaceae bacterium]|nr:DUF177 domain-containing protein [Stellaceae bacterium]
MAKTPPAPEFSRLVEVPRALGKDVTLAIAASPAECAALAQRFDLVSLDRLEAELRLERLAGELVRLTATLIADLAQSCVVTLEPIATRVEENFTLLYGTAETAREIVLDSEAETVEPYDGVRIDVGEAVAQQLSLALDPFPRAPGASIEPEP